MADTLTSTLLLSLAVSTTAKRRCKACRVDGDGLRGTDLAPLASALIARASTDEADADALMELSIVLQLQGIHDLGVTHRRTPRAPGASIRRRAPARRASGCSR